MVDAYDLLDEELKKYISHQKENMAITTNLKVSFEKVQDLIKLA